MPELLDEQGFSERFTELIAPLKIRTEQTGPLSFAVHYGDDEPVLTISLQDSFGKYLAFPEDIDAIFAPFIRELGWTVHEPRVSSKTIIETVLPILRNLTERPWTEDELSIGQAEKLGPVVYEEYLQQPLEQLVVEFVLPAESSSESGAELGEHGLVPLRRGHMLRSVPDAALLSQIAAHNLALKIAEQEITATPLPFDRFQAKAWLVGVEGGDYLRPHYAAMSLIPQIMRSLEESLHVKNSLLVLIPGRDQIIVSADPSEQELTELGVLAGQLKARAPYPVSQLLWLFKDGQIDKLQAVELGLSE